MSLNKQKSGNEGYPVELYTELLEYVKNKYVDQYWHVLPKKIASFWWQNHAVQSTWPTNVHADYPYKR